MNEKMRRDADQIISAAIAGVLPDEAVRSALKQMEFPGDVILVAVGKAAWQMASAAVRCLSRPPREGIVLTKYGHVQGEIPGLCCMEAGHPIPDENSFRGTEKILDMTEGLSEKDTVLFLLSGGGSALFEDPLIDPGELQDITEQLLACGADISEINTIRKRLSRVKGGRFGEWCSPAKIRAVILSDVLGDPPHLIASGPTVPDPSTCDEARAIAEKYRLKLSERAKAALARETPKELSNTEFLVTGSVRQLCIHAAEACRTLGYEPLILTDHLDWEAREAGIFLADMLKTCVVARCPGKKAFLAGGETVVHVTGKGLGGRNQELALAAAAGIAGIRGAAVFSVGSDGTDGPTDAAGGYVDGDTKDELKKRGVSAEQALQDNDAYHALKQVDGLIITGPTGTNVNDVAVALWDGKGDF